jgi:hypothetical protein
MAQDHDGMRARHAVVCRSEETAKRRCQAESREVAARYEQAFSLGGLPLVRDVGAHIPVRRHL